MTDDAELLRRYSAERSEAAFEELVRRHVDLVYSAALRRTAGDHHRAQEVTQMVFINLARKAAALVRHPVLPAWLHRSTSYVAADARRREARRTNYERVAAAEDIVTAASGDTVNWQEVRPVLDQAIDHLAARDREAIILRFFGNRSFAEVGRRLGLSENAARMRVDRALDKLKERLANRGVNSSAAALALGLSAQTVAAAPAGVAAAATAAALAAGPSAIGAITLLTFMTANKLPLTLLSGALVLGTGTVIVQQKAIAGLQAEAATLSSATTNLDSMQAENRKLVLSVQEAQALSDGAGDLASLKSEQKSLTAQIGALMHRQAVAKPKVAIAQVFDPSQLDQIPQPTVQPRPAYPFEMRRAGLSGSVVVDFVVDSTGAVQNAFAASSTQREFEASAVWAVGKWRFSAGQKAGRAVATHLQVPIQFALVDDATPQASAASNAFTTSTTPLSSSGPSDWFPSNGN